MAKAKARAPRRSVEWRIFNVRIPSALMPDLERLMAAAGSPTVSDYLRFLVREEAREMRRAK